jgi:cathepsin B
LCAQSGGKFTGRLSPQHILSCDKQNQGCKGGAVNQAFEFAKKEGLADEKCMPYNPESTSDCPNHVNSCSKERVLDYCVTNSEEGLKREIYKNGPIVSIIPIYKDFLTYSKGTYHVIEGTPRFQGGHIVKVIGWDRDETGEGYWIVENSWGETWGINGFAHIAHGQKQLLIEEFSLAVTPFIEGQEAPETSGEAAANEAGREEEGNHLSLHLLLSTLRRSQARCR